MTPKTSLTVVILSYNVSPLLADCLASITGWDTIVVDNGSTDDSVAMVKKRFPKVKLLETGKNLGFAAGNNFAIPHITTDYVLFLNPDTKVLGRAIEECLKFLIENLEFGAVGCRVELPDGRLDYSCHRGLPTPWNSLCYFLGLAKLFPKSKLFAGYTATYLDINTPHQVECITGAFLLLRRTAGEQIGWWDEDYFWNGDDIELCYKLKANDYKIMYLPQEKILHYKGSTSGLYKSEKVKVAPEIRRMATMSGTQAMRIFMRKHYHTSLLLPVVLVAINILEKYRLWLKYQ